jgi:predicted RNA-binding Zn ribbon-like protein
VPEGLGFPRITGKKGSRRWRSMKIWGNTLKLAAYQKRRRATDISGN